MELKNTSKRPDLQVIVLVTFGFQALNLNTNGLLVKVKHMTKGAYRGSTYHGVPSISSAARRDPNVKQLITISVGDDCKYPTKNTSKVHKKIGTIRYDNMRQYEAARRRGQFPIDDNYYHHANEHMNGTVTVQIFQVKEVPYGGLNSVEIVMNNWQEGLLATAAHEAYHVYQIHRQNLGYHCPLSESAAEWYAHERLEAWRANLSKLGLEMI